MQFVFDAKITIIKLTKCLVYCAHIRTKFVRTLFIHLIGQRAIHVVRPIAALSTTTAAAPALEATATAAPVLAATPLVAAASLVVHLGPVALLLLRLLLHHVDHLVRDAQVLDGAAADVALGHPPEPVAVL